MAYAQLKQSLISSETQTTGMLPIAELLVWAKLLGIDPGVLQIQMYR